MRITETIIWLCFVFCIASSCTSKLLRKQESYYNSRGSNGISSKLILKANDSFHLENILHLNNYYTKGTWRQNQDTITIKSDEIYNEYKIKTEKSKVNSYHWDSINILVVNKDNTPLNSALVEVSKKRYYTNSFGVAKVPYIKDSIYSIQYIDKRCFIKEKEITSDSITFIINGLNESSFYLNNFKFYKKGKKIISQDGVKYYRTRNAN